MDKRWEAHQRLPRATVTDMLTWYLDVTTPPTPNMLRMMAVMATDESEQARLKQLATVSRVGIEREVDVFSVIGSIQN